MWLLVAWLCGSLSRQYILQVENTVLEPLNPEVDDLFSSQKSGKKKRSEKRGAFSSQFGIGLARSFLSFRLDRNPAGTKINETIGIYN